MIWDPNKNYIKIKWSNLLSLFLYLRVQPLTSCKFLCFLGWRNQIIYPWVFPSLHLADCISVVMFNMLLCPLYFCKVWFRFRFNLFGRNTCYQEARAVYFYQEVHVWWSLCAISSHWESSSWPIYSIGLQNDDNLIQSLIY